MEIEDHRPSPTASKTTTMSPPSTNQRTLRPVQRGSSRAGEGSSDSCEAITSLMLSSFQDGLPSKTGHIYPAADVWARRAGEALLGSRHQHVEEGIMTKTTMRRFRVALVASVIGLALAVAGVALAANFFQRTHLTANA